ncbi:MAG: DMT family transporter, partial [Hyphococcus sp.]
VLPPIYYAAIRMTVVAALLTPFLRWRPGRMAPVLTGGLCLGSLNYALMFTGVKFATASAAAIAIELYVPFATILSMLFLGDVLGWRRILGIGLAFAGVAVIALGDQGQATQPARIGAGVGLVAAGAFSEAVGAVLVKQAKEFKPLELLAWFSFVGSGGLWILTYLIEDGQRAALAAADPAIAVGAILYSAIGASIFGHTAYYWLLQRLPVSIVAPSALLTTVMAVAFSVWLLNDPFGLRMIIGGLMTLAGVGIVLLRTATKENAKTPVAEADVVP